MLNNYRANAISGQSISFQNDESYIDFMHSAMKLLNEIGKTSVSVRGSSRMSQGRLYIILCNNLDVLVRE